MVVTLNPFVSSAVETQFCIGLSTSLEANGGLHHG
jgi:hypothetical protein